MPVTQTYIDLLTSQHRAQPKFSAMVAMNVQPFVDCMTLLESVPTLFDIDQAVGQQLDVIGEWVGISRNLVSPITSYFAWDLVGVGWDQGTWKLPSDPAVGLTVLPDTHYRALLKAKILNNHWDCDIPDAYTLMNTVFSQFGFTIAIKDNGNLTMDLILVGATPPDLLLWDLFYFGLLDIRPAGVQITSRTYAPSLALLDSSFVLDVSKLV